MFDIGFAELLIVAVVGLLVLGPERLPHAVRTGSKWYNKLKRGFNAIKADVERELGADEIRQQLRTESITKSFEKDREQLKELDEQVESANTELLDSFLMLEEKTPPTA